MNVSQDNVTFPSFVIYYIWEYSLNKMGAFCRLKDDDLGPLFFLKKKEKCNKMKKKQIDGMILG